MPAWFETYLGLETEDFRLYIFELGALPDLLQTGDYTTAVLDAKSTTTTPNEQAMVVSLWQTRQNRLTGDTAIKLDAFIAEGALRQRVGGPAVMRAQAELIAHLSAELPPP